MNEETNCDVFVLGTGLASLCLTRLLQLELPGAVVVSADTGSGPSRKVGESTVEIGAHFLNERLRLGELLRRTQLPKNGLRYWFDDEEHTQSLAEASEDGPITFSYWQSFQIERDTLERDLLELNRAGGAEHVFDASDVELSSGEDGHRIAFTHDGKRRSIRARWLVDGTGVASRLSGGREAFVPEERIPHGACWARFKNFGSPVQRLRECGDKRPIVGHRLLSTNHLMNEGYWIWWIPLASGLMSVGLVYDNSAFDDVPRGQAEFVEFLRRHRMCAELMEDAELVDFGAARNFAFKPKRFLSTDRTALIGVAAGFGDPFYSSGNDFIAIQCEYLCEVIRRDRAGDLGWRDDVDVYGRFISAFYEQVVLFVSGVYRSFASHELSVPRYRRDLHVYWNLYVWPYFSGEFKDPAFLARFLPLAQEARVRGGFFNRLLRHAAGKLQARGTLRRDNRGAYTFNQLGFRLFPYIRFERQMGHAMDLEFSRRLLHEMDTGTFLALLDALFDGDRSPVRGIVYDALHGQPMEEILALEREHGFGGRFWGQVFRLLSEQLRDRLTALGVDPAGFEVGADDYAQLRARLVAACAGNPQHERAVEKLYLAPPELEQPAGMPPMRDTVQPPGTWSFEHTPWIDEPPNWETAYEHMQRRSTPTARYFA